MVRGPKFDGPEDRRTFFRTLAAAPLLPGALAALAPAEMAVAQESASPFAGPVDALAEVVRLRFADYLAAGDMDEIKRGIERMLRNAEAISKVRITNGDEPDFMFHPHDSL